MNDNGGTPNEQKQAGDPHTPRQPPRILLGGIYRIQSARRGAYGHNDTEDQRHPRRTSRRRWPDWVTALATAGIFVVTAIYAVFAALQWNATRDQLDEMKAGRRPWLQARERMGGDLTYNVNGMNLSFIFTVHNSGLVPALGAFINMQAYSVLPNVLQPEVDKVCELSPGVIGYDIFPNETRELPWGTILSQEDIEAHWRAIPQLRPMLVPYVVACVTYRSPLDKLVHHTPLVFEVRRIKSDNPKRSPASIFVDEGDISLSNLNAVDWIGMAGRSD